MLSLEISSATQTASARSHTTLLPQIISYPRVIILNLVSNAIKHTQEGGSIHVNYSEMDDKINISVKDNGEGIPEEKRDLIFDRFRQVNTSLTRSSEGSGIGLSLTKSLVEMLYGRIWFQSTPGTGSEFFVELPYLQMKEDEQYQQIEQLGMNIEKRIQMEFSDIDFNSINIME